MRTPEGREKDKICRWLTERGAWHCKPATWGYGQRGIPDILACLDGRFIALEVKRPGGKLTALQIITLRTIEKAGGVVASGTSEEIISCLLTTIRF